MSYAEAKAKYAALGIDTDAAIAKLKTIPVALHCWQGDDVRGFDTDPNKPLTGGIQTTGNYPGRARTPEELMADIDLVLKLCPGTKKMNLHACYAIFDEENGGWVDRDKLEPKHFQKWVDFCKERNLGCDFNPTFFSHPKCDPLTLASPNEETRKFWVEHGKASIRISNYLAEELGQLPWLVACGGFYIAYQEWLAWFILLLVLALPWFSFALSLPAMLRWRAGPDITVGGVQY